MNKNSLVLLQFYQSIIMIRDTVEFVLNDGELNLQAIEARKEFFAKTKEAEHFVKFFNSFEQGPKILGQINELYNDVYENPNSIVEVEGKKRVNFAIRVKLLDFITGLHETLYEIMKNSIKPENGGDQVDPLIHQLVIAEDEYFRCLMAFADFRVIIPHSGIYNRFMNEEIKVLTEEGKNPVTKELVEKAVATPRVKQIRDILRKLVGFITFTQQKYLAQFNEGAGINDDIKSMFDKVVVALKFMDGSIKADNPKDIEDKVKEAQEAIANNLRFYENIWKSTYQNALDDARQSQEEAKKS